jgi:hypothetical protein
MFAMSATRRSRPTQKPPQTTTPKTSRKAPSLLTPSHQKRIRHPLEKNCLKKKNLQLAGSPTETTTTTNPVTPTTTITTGHLSPAIRLQGPWALQRERGDHLEAELDAQRLILLEAKKVQQRLVAEIELRDAALERTRRTSRQDKGTNEVLTSQLEDLRSDLMAERARNVGMERMQEEARQEHDSKEQMFEKERITHDQLNNEHRAILGKLLETQEEVDQMHVLYDAVESERNELQTTVLRLVEEVKLLRHVRSQKDTHITLLAKEKERLHQHLSKEKLRVARRKATTHRLSSNVKSATRTKQLEKEQLQALLGDVVASARSDNLFIVRHAFLL